jgi:hypothetical protein
MKKTLIALFASGCCALSSTSLYAQETPQLDARQKEEAEASPLIFSFAPNYKNAQQREREELELKIAEIDTMDISETRKFKLIRDLYRKKETKRLQKAFEESREPDSSRQ